MATTRRTHARPPAHHARTHIRTYALCTRHTTRLDSTLANIRCLVWSCSCHSTVLHHTWDPRRPFSGPCRDRGCSLSPSLPRSLVGIAGYLATQLHRGVPSAMSWGPAREVPPPPPPRVPPSFAAPASSLALPPPRHMPRIASTPAPRTPTPVLRTANPQPYKRRLWLCSWPKSICALRYSGAIALHARRPSLQHVDDSRLASMREWRSLGPVIGPPVMHGWRDHVPSHRHHGIQHTTQTVP